MTCLLPELARIRAVLHPLDAAPQGPGWNAAELAGLLLTTQSAGAAVLVGLVPRQDGLHVLLTRRNDAMRHHAGQVAFPGGRIEVTDADACAAAIRETWEETGVPASQLLPLGYLDPLVTITGFHVLPLVAAVAPDYVATADPREVDEIFEVPLAFLMSPANLEKIDIDLDGRPRSILQFVRRDSAGQRIWGATASILYNLRQRLEATPDR